MAAAEDVGGAAFTAESTRAMLRAACEPVELDWRDAELARLGENAIFVLRRAGAVVRIARSAERAAVAAKEVAVARWLSGLGFPVVRALGEVAQPRSVAGHPVTYWELIEGPHTPGSSVDIAVFLRRLHGLTSPPELELPALDPFVPIPWRIESARGVAEDDRDFLRWRLADLQSRFRAAEFVLGTAVLHGDAHDGNVMRDSNDNVVIFDLENVAVGPPEWDLSLVATYHDSLGWWSAEEYGAYIEAYGADVRELSAWTTLRATHELQMHALPPLADIVVVASDAGESLVACEVADAAGQSLVGAVSFRHRRNQAFVPFALHASRPVGDVPRSVGREHDGRAEVPPVLPLCSLPGGPDPASSGLARTSPDGDARG